MSALVRSNRSSSRLSMSSKRGGGSRASDEDGKTAVKVGECFCGLVNGSRRTRRYIPLTQRSSRSRPCATSPQSRRSRIRVDTPTVQRRNMPGHDTDEFGGRVRAGQKVVRLRSRLRRRCRSGRSVGISPGECQFFRTGLQCLHSCIWAVRRWQVLHDGHNRATRAGR